LLLLDKYDAYATFFVVGKYIEMYLDGVRKIIQKGHEIGNHSWDHAKLVFKSRPYFINREIPSTDSIIREMEWKLWSCCLKNIVQKESNL